MPAVLHQGILLRQAPHVLQAEVLVQHGARVVIECEAHASGALHCIIALAIVKAAAARLKQQRELQHLKQGIEGGHCGGGQAALVLGQVKVEDAVGSIAPAHHATAHVRQLHGAAVAAGG